MKSQLGLALVFTLVLVTASLAVDWPEWMGSNRDGVWRETGIVDKFPTGGPKVLWRVPLGPGYSGPSVANGRLYVMDRQPTPGADGKPANVHGANTGKERLVCLEATTGKVLWIQEYDCDYKLSYGAGPRSTPLVRDGRVYALGAMGDFKCHDANTGDVIWSRNLPKEYKCSPPVWGYAAHPLLDGDRLYTLAGGEDSAVVCLDKNTGKEIWKALTATEVCYSPPIITEAGGKRQLIIWMDETINSLDPATGKSYWSIDYPPDGSPQRPAACIVQPQRSGDYLFVSSYYHGPMMLKLAADKPAAEVLWKDKTKNLRKLIGLHSLMASPIIKDGHIYGTCANGELRCIDVKTGDQLWEDFSATGGKKTDCGTAFIIPQGDRYILFNDQGELILAHLSPKGYTEIDRAKIIDAVEVARGRTVVWSHPAFANRCVFVRNFKEIICVSLTQEGPASAIKALSPPA